MVEVSSEQRVAGLVSLRWSARAAGILATITGMAVSDLVAWLAAPAGAPLPAVGSLVINVLPAPLVNWGKDTLGTADKPVLLAIIALAVLAVGGFAGELELKRPYAGLTCFVPLAAIGLVAVAAGGQSLPRAFLPIGVGFVLAYLLLNSLLRRLRGVQVTDSESRRRFLRLVLGGGAVAVVGAVAGRLLAAAAGAVADARARLRLPVATTKAIVPARADFAIDGLSPYITPNQDFYRIDTALQVPAINPDEWSLRVTGLVDKEVSITYAELAARPLVEHLTTLTCVSNEVGGDLVGNALWLGYPVRDLLAEASPKAGADMVLSISHDGWSAGTPLSVLTDPDRQALLAIGMNGEPLPLEHGFPVRMVVPGLYGYVSATKWVRELKVTTFAEDQGYWTPLGWSALGPVKLASRIDVPRRSTVDARPVVVAGVAWAQHTGIRGVELRVDDGPWQACQLAAVSGPDTWRQWRFLWDAPAGHHTVTVRATDANGEVQIEAPSSPAPDGATGYHSVGIQVR
jgi:DMSO/TMAO reductase YedYZ molybdopterin-dependent catalytic subunit